MIGMFSMGSSRFRATLGGCSLLAIAAICAPHASWAQGGEPSDKHVVTSAGAKRAHVLSDLYEQLSRTRDQQSAELIASTIEKLWLKSGSETVDILMSRAIRLVQNDEYDVALKILDAVVEIAPDYSEGWNQRATVHYLKHDLQDSLNDLRHVLALDPHHFKAVNGLGLILQELGDDKAALRAYRRALQLNPFLDETRQSVDELEREVEGQGI